jgi:hypothetical protein
MTTNELIKRLRKNYKKLNEKEIYCEICPLSFKNLNVISNSVCAFFYIDRILKLNYSYENCKKAIDYYKRLSEIPLMETE